MKITFALVMLLLLAGAGCTPGTPQYGSGDRPPEITMQAEGKAVAGVEGSYCNTTMCVDKVGPAQLAAEAGLSFVDLPRENLKFAIDADVDELSLSLVGANGNSILGSDATVEKGADGMFTYTIPHAVTEGDYYLMAFASFEQGGDVSYVFPISIE